MIKSFFSYLESVNYEDYTKSLSEQEFFDIYEKECYEFDLKNPILQRGIKRNEDFIYINTDKHYTLTKELDQYKILFDITNYWKGFPSKYKSLDFYHSRGRMSQTYETMYGNPYYLIPFNGARFATRHCLFGNDWRFVSDNLCGNILAQVHFIFLILIKYYQKYIKKEFDVSNWENEFNILGEFILKLEEIKPIYGYEKISLKIILNIKRLMIEKNKNMFDLIIYLFDPYKNGVKLLNLDQLLTEKDYVGWTDSKVLMVKKDLFDKKIKNNNQALNFF